MDRSLDRSRSNMPGALDSAQITGTNTNTNPTLDVVNVNNNNEEAVATASPRVPPPPCMVREQDQYMPIANVIRIMRRILPPHAKISDDAKETVQECVSEYISFITGEANERCQREQRKTVTAEDVLWAMGKLGFDNYLEPLSVFLNKYREAEGSDKTTSLFVKRERGPESGMLEYVVPHYGPGGTYAPTTHHQPGMYEAGGGMNGYYRDGGSGGGRSSSSTQGHGQNGAVGGGGFDPFAQFK